MRLSLVRSTSAFNCRAPCWRTSGGAPTELAFDGRPSRVCSGAELLLLLAAASTTAALLLLPAVTLHRPAPRRDQARRRPATRPPAPPRVQVQHARLLPVEPRPSHSPSRRRLPLRGAPCTQLLPARLSQRQPVGVHAAGPDHQLRANFPGARAARSASPPRSGARRKKWAWWGMGRSRFATEVDTKVFYGENLFL